MSSPFRYRNITDADEFHRFWEGMETARAPASHNRAKPLPDPKPGGGVARKRRDGAAAAGGVV